MAKYSATGVLLWQRELAPVGIGTDFLPISVSADGKGDLYIAGDSNGVVYIVKYSATGARLWERQIAMPVENHARGVATDVDGHVYIAGYTVRLLGPNEADTRAWVAKYSAAGAPIWRRELPGTGNSADGVATDDGDGVYLAGSTWASLGGPNQGGQDVFLAKYSQRR
jgi:hypothetical protein